MGNWDEELISLLPKSCKVFASAGKWTYHEPHPYPARIFELRQWSNEDR